MTHRILSGKKGLLRVFLGEDDKVQHRRLSELLIEKAREEDMAGCTVLLGLAGYGAGRLLHTPMDLECSGRLAMVVELVDEKERIQGFWRKIEPLLAKAGSMVIEEEVYVHHYAAKPIAQSKGQKENTMEIPMAETHPKELNGENTLLRIYVGESDKAGHEALYLAIVKRARKLGVAGCTAIRGVSGFGATSVIHENHLFRISQDLPIVIEAVDQSGKIHEFLEQIQPLLQGTLVTEEKVFVHHYQGVPRTGASG